MSFFNSLKGHYKLHQNNYHIQILLRSHHANNTHVHRHTHNTQQSGAFPIKHKPSA